MLYVVGSNPAPVTRIRFSKAIPSDLSGDVSCWECNQKL